MKVFSNKTPAMAKLLEDIAGKRVSEGECMTCSSTAIRPEDFSDDISRKEYTISGMCEKCQNGVFG